MDRRLAELNISSRDTIWKEYGGGLRENEKATLENWKRIAENDILYGMYARTIYIMWFRKLNTEHRKAG